MELTFNMSAEDYFFGWQLRDKKTNLPKNSMNILSIVAITIVCIGTAAYFKSFMIAGTMAIFDVIFVLYSKKAMKKSIMKQFDSSVILRGKHTLRTYPEGLEILNSYEKIFVPWQSLYCVKETETHLLILPTAHKGIIAVNKAAFAGNELDRIIEQLRARVNIEEGK